MSVALRILLFAGSVLTAIYVLVRIRNSKMRTEDSLFWLFFSLALVILSIFPSLAGTIAQWLGVISTANLVFAVIIFFLIIKLLMTDQKVSRLEADLARFAQEYAIAQEEARTCTDVRDQVQHAQDSVRNAQDQVQTNKEAESREMP